MFKKLTEFGYKRTAPEAIGFYLAYLGLTLLMAFFVGVVLGVIFPKDSAVAYASAAGKCVVLIVSIGLIVWIMYEKNLLKEFRGVLWAVLTGIIAAFLAAGFDILAPIPAAVLTTLKPAKEAKKTKRKSRK